MKKFVFDLDDTVCMSDEYSEKYISEFIDKHVLPYTKVCDKVRFAEEKFSWSKEVALDWYKKYGDQMMLEFPCKEGSVEVINSLYDAGNRIIIATARATDWHCDPEGVTKEWLEKVGIKYHKLYVGRVDKENICEIEGADYFMDDDVKITSKVANHLKNIKVFLMTSKYNEDLMLDEKVERVKDFEDFKSRIR